MNKKIKFNILIVIMLVLMIPTIVFATETNGGQTDENQNATETPETSNNNQNTSGTDESEQNTSTKVIEVTSISLTKEKLTLVEGEDEKLTVSFDPVDATDKTITWTTNDKDVATVSDKGVVTALKEGTAVIKATSKSGSKEATCVVTVNKKVDEKKSSDYSLKSLTITNGTLDKEFDPTIYEYNVTVDKNVSELNFDWKFNNNKTKYLISNNNSIRTGQIVKFLPIAEDGTKGKEYKFIIKKEEANLNLKSLTIKGYSLNETFNPEKLEYTAEIPFEAVDVTVQTAAEDDGAKIKINGATDLIVGKNIVVVTVTDTSGNEREYKITVTRLAEDEREVTGNSSKYTSSTSDNITSSSVAADDTGTRSNHLLRYIFVTLGCIILFAIGAIGIYFYIITSTKTKKRNNKNKNTPFELEEEEESSLVEISEDNKESNEKITEDVSSDLEKTVEFYDKDLNEIKKKNDAEIRKDIEELLDD